MGIDIRLPNITATTTEGQLLQMRSYLYQLSEQLKWALENIEVGEAGAATSSSAVKTSTGESEKIDPVNTFNAVKSLIVKSADIVNAYYEEINRRIEGIYVAQSEFGTYSKKTSQDITQNSTNINLAFESIQEISSTVEEIETTLLDVNAYIKSGLLEYGPDGIPVYGLEIGQRNTVDEEEVFNKYARFSADRLSFYDQNDTEVAYVSDYKLYITAAEVAGSLTIGKYEIDSSDGLTFRWVGGE